MDQSLRLPAPGASLVRHQRVYHVAVSPATEFSVYCQDAVLGLSTGILSSVTP